MAFLLSLTLFLAEEDLLARKPDISDVVITSSPDLRCLFVVGKKIGVNQIIIIPFATAAVLNDLIGPFKALLSALSDDCGGSFCMRHILDDLAPNLVCLMFWNPAFGCFFCVPCVFVFGKFADEVEIDSTGCRCRCENCKLAGE